MEISNYITQITNKLFKLYFLSLLLSLIKNNCRFHFIVNRFVIAVKNNYRDHFIVYRFVIAVKKKTIIVIVLSFYRYHC